jgi:glucuronate isomerase
MLRGWLERLSAVSGVSCDTFPGMLEALAKRHEWFHENGGRLSDHGLPHCYAEPCDTETAARIFDRALAGSPPAEAELSAYRSFLMRYFGFLDAEKGWCKQLHLGPLRNNNSRLHARLGADIGCDSMDDLPQAAALNRYLDLLDKEGHLPKMVVYNLNPKDNYSLATAIGNFQGRSPGYLQFGSGWWFLDSIEGMEWQINALSHTGLLSRFVGMLTDSRSFLSAPRHEYFRRILCNLVGRDMHEGRLPSDYSLVGGMIRSICYQNAKSYFGMEVNT